MKQAISGAGIPPGIISIKAKTNEKNGIYGKGRRNIGSGGPAC